MQFLLLFDEEFFEGSFEFGADPGDFVNVGHSCVDQVLVEGSDHKQFLKNEKGSFC